MPAGDTVSCGAILLLSSATGIVQFTEAVEFTLRLARMSEGQLRNTGGTTSVMRGEIGCGFHRPESRFFCLVRGTVFTV